LEEDPVNVAVGYNRRIDQAEEDVLIFAHHDVILPNGFFQRLRQQIGHLPKNWGVAGVAGVSEICRPEINNIPCYLKVYSYLYDGCSISSNNVNEMPHEVRVLDELLLVVPKRLFVEKLVSFDEKIPSKHHFFGADLCLQANRKGFSSHVMKNFCFHMTKHNTSNKHESSFVRSFRYMASKWKNELPIVTTCTRIDNGRTPMKFKNRQCVCSQAK